MFSHDFYVSTDISHSLGVFHYSCLLLRSYFLSILLRFDFFYFSSPKDFRLLLPVLSFSLRFISAQTTGGTSSFRPSGFFFSLSRLEGRKKSSSSASWCLLLPPRWRPTCRSERVSDRTIKPRWKKAKEKKKNCPIFYVRLGLFCVLDVLDSPSTLSLRAVTFLRGHAQRSLFPGE